MLSFFFNRNFVVISKEKIIQLSIIEFLIFVISFLFFFLVCFKCHNFINFVIFVFIHCSFYFNVLFSLCILFLMYFVNVL